MRRPIRGIRRQQGGGIPQAVDPTTRSLTGLWYADSGGEYDGSPWAGVASLGTSGSNSLTEATNPPAVGSNLNGHPPADFDGSADELTGSTLDTYLGSTWHASVLVYPDAAPAPISVGHDPYLIGEAAGGWCISFSTLGVRLRQIDSVSTKDTAAVAMATGEWSWVDAWYDGANINLSVNGGTPASTAALELLNPNLRTMKVGVSAFGNFFNGKIAAIILESTDPGGPVRTGYRLWANQKYDLTL